MATEYALSFYTQKSQKNHLLASLQAESFARLSPHFKFVDLPLGKVLYEPGWKIQHVYFPTDSIISLLYVTNDGACTEISVVGNEGVLGVPLFMGGESSSSRALVRNAGGAFVLPREILKEEFDCHGRVMELLLYYTQTLIIQMAQTAVCNRHHHIDQQLCRWLLMSLDRLPGNSLQVTHEMIANMLGVRREGVTEAAGKLQRLGVITYRRGRIEVLERAKLESLCCECYSVVRRETDRLLNWGGSGLVLPYS